MYRLEHAHERITIMRACVKMLIVGAARIASWRARMKSFMVRSRRARELTKGSRGARKEKESCAKGLMFVRAKRLTCT